ASEPGAVAARVEAEQLVALSFNGGAESVELLPTEVLVETHEKEGFAVAQEGGLVVALDTELDEQLLQEGLARDLVRTLNDMRKAAGFDISDRIVTYYALGQDGKPEDEARARGALANYRDYIRAETLSNDLVPGEPPDGAYSQREKIGLVEVTLGVRKARE